jgi:hypothetical protein
MHRRALFRVKAAAEGLQFGAREASAAALGVLIFWFRVVPGSPLI